MQIINVVLDHVFYLAVHLVFTMLLINHTMQHPLCTAFCKYYNTELQYNFRETLLQ